MKVPYPILHTELLHADPVGSIRPPQPIRLPATLAVRLSRTRELARRTTVRRSLLDLPERLREVEQVGLLTLCPDGPSMAGRHPLVLAHGPSLNAILPAVRAKRDRLFLIAPFRTALVLADAGLIADIAVLAYPAPGASEECVAAWLSASPEARRQLTQHTSLLIDAFAPVAVFRQFRSTRLFDDGAGLLDEEAQLPCWGNALVTSLAYALHHEAPAIAIAGVDLTAASGPAGADWTGRRVRLSRRHEVLYRLLGLLTSTPAALVDLSSSAIKKPGFTHESLEHFLLRPAAPCLPAARARQIRASAIAERMVDDAAGLTITARAMAAVAGRAVRLAGLAHATASDRAELAEAVNQMEHGWLTDPASLAVVQLLQPKYLRALWELGALVKPLHVMAANRYKAKLIGGEFLDLVSAFDRWLAQVCPTRSVDRAAKVA